MNLARIGADFFSGWTKVQCWMDDGFMGGGIHVKLFMAEEQLARADKTLSLVVVADVEKFAAKLVVERRKSGLRRYGRKKKLCRVQCCLPLPTWVSNERHGP